MIRSLWNAASGLRAAQIRVDNVAHNVANINTPGYRRAQVDFADLLYQEMAAGRLITGNGVRPMLVTQDLSPGPLEQTGKELDLAVDGQGFFVLRTPEGELRYTRDGSFGVDAQGRVVSAQGLHVMVEGQPDGTIHVPAGATSLTVQSDGLVLCTSSEGGEPVSLGRIQLALPAPLVPGQTAGMLPIGGNLFIPAENTTLAFGVGGQEGAGAVRQGWLERSNVVLADELVELILAQRSFELNSRAIQAADHMLSLANGIHRG
jgi:flagellar basal-body rod protein FlgG